MTTLYLIRHGQTDNNLLGAFNGSESDAPLNKTGMEMAVSLTDAFADIRPDAIYSSPIRRAYMTAEGVRGNRNIPILTDPDLMEMHFGEWNGMPFQEVMAKYPREIKYWCRGDQRFKPPGSEESIRDVSVRMFRAILRIVRAHRGGTVVIASHGTALRLWITRALGLPVSQCRKIKELQNVAYGVIEIEDDGHFTVRDWDKRDHYHPEQIVPPRRKCVKRVMKKVLGKKHFHPAFKAEKAGQSHAN